MEIHNVGGESKKHIIFWFSILAKRYKNKMREQRAAAPSNAWLRARPQEVATGN